ALSYVVSSGNESDLGAGEFFEYMVQDSSTDVILLFIEGIRDVDKFLAAARRAAEIRKPVIVTKVGRSGAGERAAASHTASMAGWSVAYDAVFTKYGFIISNDLDEAVTIAAVLKSNPMPKGDPLAVLTAPGGAFAIERDADAVQAAGIEAGSFGAEQADRVLLLYAAFAVCAQRIGGVGRGGALGPDARSGRDAAHGRVFEFQAGAGC